MHKKLPHLIYFASATNYLNVFMSTTVLLGLTSFEKNWGPVDFWGGPVDFWGGPVTFQWLQELNVEGCVSYCSPIADNMFVFNRAMQKSLNT